MAEQEGRSGRKRTRNDDGNASARGAEVSRSREFKRFQEMMEEAYQRHLNDPNSSIAPLLRGAAFQSKTPDLNLRNHDLVGRDQAHTDGEEEAAHDQEHDRRFTMEETHDQQGGDGNQAAEEEHERPTQTPASSDRAGAPSPGRQLLDSESIDAVEEENEEQVNLDVGREVVGHQAGLPSHQEQLDDSAGGNEIDSSRGEGSEESEIEENRATRRRKGEWIAVSRKKTRTKTTTTKTTTKTNDTTRITTVTKTTTKVSRKRFERR